LQPRCRPEKRSLSTVLTADAWALVYETAMTNVSADTIQIDSDNPRHPPEWFVRSEDFAAVCPAPFFSEELAFPPQETLRFRYAVLVADGVCDDNRAAQLAEQGQKILAASEPVA
jgi:hypothetical protein